MSDSQTQMLPARGPIAVSRYLLTTIRGICNKTGSEHAPCMLIRFWSPHLRNHAQEGVDFKDPERHGDEVLVKKGRKGKDDNLRRRHRVAAPQHGLEHVADAEAVHGNVPRLPKDEDVVCVPPVVVELAVGEAQDLAGCVQERVKDEVKPNQPDEVVRELKQT
jgi:hypothetical protein